MGRPPVVRILALEKGMFANQNSACTLRQAFTLDRLATHFGVADEDQ